jgi:hypothetical protein
MWRRARISTNSRPKGGNIVQVLTVTPRLPPRKLPRLVPAPGRDLRLLVMSTGPRHCAGIDLATGTLVRAWCSGLVDQRLRPYDVAKVTVAANTDLVPDPSEPEAVATAGPPELAGRLTGRPARRLIAPLLHPDNQPLLGTHSPAVPFWERSRDHPSVALVQPPRPLMVSIEAERLWCHFPWLGREHVLTCTDPRLWASLSRSGRNWALLRGGTIFVVALAPPVDGHCHKVVEAVVPPR